MKIVVSFLLSLSLLGFGLPAQADAAKAKIWLKQFQDQIRRNYMAAAKRIQAKQAAKAGVGIGAAAGSKAATNAGYNSILAASAKGAPTAFSGAAKQGTVAAAAVGASVATGIGAAAAKVGANNAALASAKTGAHAIPQGVRAGSIGGVIPPKVTYNPATSAFTQSPVARASAAAQAPTTATIAGQKAIINSGNSAVPRFSPGAAALKQQQGTLASAQQGIASLSKAAQQGLAGANTATRQGVDRLSTAALSTARATQQGAASVASATRQGVDQLSIATREAARSAQKSVLGAAKAAQQGVTGAAVATRRGIEQAGLRARAAGQNAVSRVQQTAGSIRLAAQNPGRTLQNAGANTKAAVSDAMQSTKQFTKNFAKNPIQETHIQRQLNPGRFAAVSSAPVKTAWSGGVLTSRSNQRNAQRSAQKWSATSQGAQFSAFGPQAKGMQVLPEQEIARLALASDEAGRYAAAQASPSALAAQKRAKLAGEAGPFGTFRALIPDWRYGVANTNYIRNAERYSDANADDLVRRAMKESQSAKSAAPPSPAEAAIVTPAA